MVNGLVRITKQEFERRAENGTFDVVTGVIKEITVLNGGLVHGLKIEKRGQGVTNNQYNCLPSEITPGGKLGLPNAITLIGDTARVLIRRSERDLALERGAEREYTPIVGVAIYDSDQSLRLNRGSYFGLNP